MNQDNKSKQLIGLSIFVVIIIILIIMVLIQTPKVNLVDNNDNCEQWATENECKHNPNYMLSECAKSCNQIKSGNLSLVDNNDNCEQWARNNECTKNPGYMLRSCAKSCESLN
jgi:hypothetical protein